MPPGLDDPSELDVFAMAEGLATSNAKPVISFDCGTEDQLLPMNRRLHGHLEKLGLSHRYAEHPGGHTWAYWDQHVQEALKPHAEVFQTR
jgi:enterochelin esterase-like enzyme